MAGLSRNDLDIKEILRPTSKKIKVLEMGKPVSLTVKRNGLGLIKTSFGAFWQYNFSLNDKWEKYSVLFKGGIDDRFQPVLSNNNILLRIDSGCETGQLFQDRTCECRQQLQRMMKRVSKNSEGFIIHIPHQDGRGQGSAFKLATTLLQEYCDLNTYEAAKLVAGRSKIDIRTYSGVVGILKFFGIKKNCGINLFTNNPHKMGVLSENGYITNLVSHKIQPDRYTYKHLKAKQDNMGHLCLV